jgi:hypothetical protein
MGDSSRTRMLTSVEQRDGYLVARVYEQVGDEYTLVATCAGQPEFVMRLLIVDPDFSTLPDGVY